MTVKPPCFPEAGCQNHPGSGPETMTSDASDAAAFSGETWSDVTQDSGDTASSADYTQSPDFAGAIPEHCFQFTDVYKKIDCIAPYLAALVKTHSAQTAFCLVSSLLRDGKIHDCHFLAHIIGEANLEKYRWNPAQALAHCPLDCIQGCIHGVIERWVGYLQQTGPVAEQTLLSLCDSLQQDPLLFRQCVHGLGHGLLAHGLFSLSQALALCQKSAWPGFEDACVSGVLMENVDRYSLLPEDSLIPLLPQLCSSVQKEPTWLAMCIAAIGEGLMFYTGYDLKKSHRFCETLQASFASEMVALCKEAASEEDKNRNKNKQNVPQYCKP